MPLYDEVKQALQDFLVPELQALKAEIRRLDEKMDSLRSEMNTWFSAVEKEMNTRFSGLEKRVDELGRRMGERLESLRAELLAELRRVEGRVEALGACGHGRA